MKLKTIPQYSLAILLLSSLQVMAKTINVPSMPIELVIEDAKKYVYEKRIDVTDAFIGVVEYHNLHNEYERPYWQVRWVGKIGAKGAWFELRVYPDGSIEERRGK